MQIYISLKTWIKWKYLKLLYIFKALCIYVTASANSHEEKHAKVKEKLYLNIEAKKS